MAPDDSLMLNVPPERAKGLNSGWVGHFWNTCPQEFRCFAKCMYISPVFIAQNDALQILYIKYINCKKSCFLHLFSNVSLKQTNKKR